MGMFDDLIPKSQDAEAQPGGFYGSEPRLGMFDDLIPKTPDAEAQQGGFYGVAPITAQGRRQVQRRAMAGLDPTPDQQASLDAAKPGLEESTGRFVNTFAPVAAMPLMPMGAAAGLGRQVLQGATLGPAAGYVSGFLGGGKDGTVSEQLAARHESGTTGAAVGATLGVGLPLAIGGVGYVGSKVADAISPTVARYGTEARNMMQRLSPQPSSGGAAAADGGRGPMISGAEAAADQIIANQLSRANVPVSALRQRLSDADEAAQFYSNSRAQQMLAPVDLDNSLQRLAGSAARQQPEAGSVARDFIAGRQTGITPQGRVDGTMGLPTRPALARPQAGDAPMGQFERVKDALKRSLLIKDSDFHGHGRSAYRTEQGIIETAKREANALYGDAYKAGENVNIAPQIAPVMQKWLNRAAEEPGPIRAAIHRAVRLFSGETGPVTNLTRFDKGKQYLDDLTEKLAKGGDRSLARTLGDFKRELLEQVDTIKVQGLGDKYAAARDAFGSRMEMREALQLGRDVFREGSEVAVDQFRQLATAGQQKLFRLGLLDGFEQHMGRQARTADVTRVFDNPRIQEILREVIPRTQTATGRVKMVGGAPAEFADRPERFGRYVANEKSMIGTRNEVLGNSKTAERLADDQSFNTLSGMVEQLRQTPSLTALGMKAVETAINKLFGFRADTAAFIAHKLFTANPADRARLLQQIEARMGTSRMEQFTRLMSEYQARLAQTGSTAGIIAGQSQ